MNYWLLKTEPQTFNWDKLITEGKTMWDGVRNYEARNNIRKMKKNDLIFIYHSGKNPGIVGIAILIKESYPDPTAIKGNWSVVDIEPIRKLKNFVSLSELKQINELKNMSLLKRTRLSVHHLSEKEYNKIVELGDCC